jgi:hypothetical protein
MFALEDIQYFTALKNYFRFRVLFLFAIELFFFGGGGAVSGVTNLISGF